MIRKIGLNSLSAILIIMFTTIVWVMIAMNIYVFGSVINGYMAQTIMFIRMPIELASNGILEAIMLLIGSIFIVVILSIAVYNAIREINKE